MIVKIIQEFGRRMDAQNKKLEVFKKRIRKHKEQLNRTEEHNKWNKKKSLERINSRLNEAEEQMSELKDRVLEITASEEKKEWKIIRII